VEPKSRRERDEFFRFAKTAIHQTRKAISGLEVHRNWSRKWGRLIVSEQSPVYDDDLVERGVATLSKLYSHLKPAVKGLTTVHGRP
jgi:hypothetical protein